MNITSQQIKVAVTDDKNAYCVRVFTHYKHFVYLNKVSLFIYLNPVFAV